MSASREKKLRQDQTASGYVDPKAEKELEKKKAEKRSNVLYSVIAVLFVLVVAASFLWRSNVISRNATALTIDGETYNAAEVNFYYQNVYRGFLQSNSYFISYLGLDTNASLKSQTVNATAASMMGVEDRKFAFRQLIQNIRAVAKSFIVDCLSDSIAQTLSGIFQIVCVIAFFCKIRIIKIFSAYIVICIELGRQNIICDGSPVAGKILVLNHCLQNLLLCFRQTIIICFKNIPVIFSSDLRPCCRRQQPYHHNQRKQAAVYSFYHSIPPF